MIETCQVFSYLHNMMRKDDLAIKLCKYFLEKNPLCWVKVDSEYLASDENGRDYACIVHVNGKFLIKEGNHFDATFSPELKLDYDDLSNAIENANEILFNVGFSVLLHSFLSSHSEDEEDYGCEYCHDIPCSCYDCDQCHTPPQACHCDPEESFKPCHDDACNCLDAEEKS